MKPPSPPPADHGVDAAEQTLLRAARTVAQAEPGPAVDAAVLHAAAGRAAEIRAQAVGAAPAIQPPAGVQPLAGVQPGGQLPVQPLAQPVPAPLSPLQRFSRWLSGGGPRWVAAAASIAVVGLGTLTLFGNHIRGLFASSADALHGEVRMAAYEGKAFHAQQAPSSFGEPLAPPPPAAVSTAVAPLKPDPSPPRADLPPRRQPRTPADAASKPAGSAEHVEIQAELGQGAPLEAALKRVLALRRAGETAQAQALLRALRERFPDDDIDERLRQLEKAERAE